MTAKALRSAHGRGHVRELAELRQEIEIEIGQPLGEASLSLFEPPIARGPSRRQNGPLADLAVSMAGGDRRGVRTSRRS